jgi:hypothetical protein
MEIPKIYPVRYISGNAYWRGFPEGKAQEVCERFREGYVFFFEDMMNRRIMVDKKGSSYFSSAEDIKIYVNTIEDDGFDLVGVKTPESSKIHTNN